MADMLILIFMIDTYECSCTHHILPPKGMSDVSRDLIKFWETSDNI